MMVMEERRFSVLRKTRRIFAVVRSFTAYAVGTRRRTDSWSGHLAVISRRQTSLPENEAWKH